MLQVAPIQGAQIVVSPDLGCRSASPCALPQAICLATSWLCPLRGLSGAVAPTATSGVGSRQLKLSQAAGFETVSCSGIVRRPSQPSPRSRLGSRYALYAYLGRRGQQCRPPALPSPPGARHDTAIQSQQSFALLSCRSQAIEGTHSFSVTTFTRTQLGTGSARHSFAGRLVLCRCLNLRHTSDSKTLEELSLLFGGPACPLVGRRASLL
jgi:hypothetical protein